MINLWSHYLSTFAALHSLLILFIWFSRLLVSAHSLEKNQCWQWMFQKHQVQKSVYHHRYKTRAVLFVQGHVYDLKMPFLLYSSSKAEVILLN